ncbi:helix-turn-helix transcriptional regulator [Olsenella profusa]|nr:helix-turn-helix transcriptional regulator [Olsenella profusa]
MYVDGKRVMTAVRQIMDETERRGAPRGHGVAMLAWFVDERGGDVSGTDELDIVSASITLAELAGDAAGDDAERKVMLTVFVPSKLLVQGLTQLAAPGTDVFRVLTTTATRRHAPIYVEAPEPDRDLMCDLYANAAVAYAERRPGWEQVVEALALALVAATSPLVPEAEPGSADDALALILSEVAARPESVTLGELAARYSYSQSYLSELIHERCGKTFGELVRERRMERAAMLLRATNLPVAEVARRVGYSGTSNFHRAFREQFGCSPAELRAKGR